MFGQTIDGHLQEELNKELENTLLVLDRIFSASLFLAIQVIPFRGHRHENQEDKMQSFENSGNYLELLKLISHCDPVMAAHLATNNARGKYTSPQIQNEIIYSIDTVIKNTIV